MRMLINCLNLIGLFLLAACTSLGSESAVILEPEIDRSIPVFEQIDLETADKARIDQPFLTYTVTGGLMGIGNPETVWTFYEDGRVEASDGRSWQLSDSEVKALRNIIEPDAFAMLEPSYIPENTCCDRMQYTIGVVGNDGEIVDVTTLDGADMPPLLSQSLQSIQQLVAALAERS